MTRFSLLAWCAAASLGLLFVKANTLLTYATTSYRVPVESGVATYVPLAATLVALVAWHLAPRRSWAWLLLAGAVLTLPELVIRLAPDLYHVSLAEPLAIATACAPAASVVGIVGGATVLWQAGWRAVGAALTGTALVSQLIGPVVLGSTLDVPGLVFGNTATNVAGLVLAILAAVGAVVALVAVNRDEGALRRAERDEGALHRIEPARGAPARPGWRVTIAGGVAAAAPLLAAVWQPDPTSYPTTVENYFLYLGLALLAIGLLLGAAAGPRILLASVATGMVLGPFGMLIAPSVEVLREMPVLAVVAAAGSALLGFVAALSRWRDRLGPTGLLTVFLGLIILFGLFNSDSPFESYEDITFVVTPILLVVGVVAAVTGVATVGSVLADRAEAPAVLAGTATPFSLGAIAIVAHFTVHAPDGKAPIAGLLPPAAGGLLLAAVALLFLTRSTHEPRAAGELEREPLLGVAKVDG